MKTSDFIYKRDNGCLVGTDKKGNKHSVKYTGDSKEEHRIKFPDGREGLGDTFDNAVRACYSVEMVTDKIGRNVFFYLDYQIVDCGKFDRFVLCKPSGKQYECHLGNYGDIEDAKRAAVHFFMINRPEEFSHQVYYRMNGTHAMHDYYKFESVLKKEGLPIPIELKPLGTSAILSYKGKEI